MSARITGGPSVISSTNASRPAGVWILTLGTWPPKKCVSDPRALFSVSRSSSLTGMPFSWNHSAKPVIKLVLPTPPLPPMERTTRFPTAGAAAGDSGIFFALLISGPPEVSRNPPRGDDGLANLDIGTQSSPIPKAMGRALQDGQNYLFFRAVYWNGHF